jgi:hypothetical protein
VVTAADAAAVVEPVQEPGDHLHALLLQLRQHLDQPLGILPAGQVCEVCEEWQDHRAGVGRLWVSAAGMDSKQQHQQGQNRVAQLGEQYAVHQLQRSMLLCIKHSAACCCA